jgi:hypothetical protein
VVEKRMDKGIIVYEKQPLKILNKLKLGIGELKILSKALHPS